MSITAPAAWISGLRNCHLPGLNSYVISERTSPEQGMICVFHNEGNGMRNLLGLGIHSFADREEYMLAPHNHRQSIRLIPICGVVANVSFDLDRQSHDHRTTEWVFESAIITGTARLRYRDSIDMYVHDVKTLPPDGIVLPSHEIHTIIASQGAAWAVVEGDPAPAKQQSLCYSRRPDFAPDFSGLYEAMEWWELKNPDRSSLFARAMWELRHLGVVQREEATA